MLLELEVINTILSSEARKEVDTNPMILVERNRAIIQLDTGYRGTRFYYVLLCVNMIYVLK